MSEHKQRVLIIGLSAKVNQGVVQQVDALGFEGVGCVGLERALAADAREYDLIAVGSGVTGARLEQLRALYGSQDPETPVLWVYGPFAAKQIEWALREAPAWASGVSLELGDERVTLRADVHAVCELVVQVHRYPNDELEVTTVAQRRVEAGPLLLELPREPTRGGFMLIVGFNGEQHHLHRLAE